MMHLNLLYSYVVVDCNSRSKDSRYKLFLLSQTLEMRFHRNILISNTAYSVHFCICLEHGLFCPFLHLHPGYGILAIAL